MLPVALSRTSVESVDVLLADAGEVFQVFGHQDSYGVRTESGRWFVKAPTTCAAAASLSSAVAVHATVRHPHIVPLAHTMECPDGPILIYPWFDGVTLYEPDGKRVVGSSSPMARFRALPVAKVESVVRGVLDAHEAVAAAGFVAVDFYDGCILYDFATDRFALCDLDEYRPGPFIAHSRLPGSTRFMAPEEYGDGELIDERTTVFTLGRAIRLLLDAGDAERAWRGTHAQLAVVRKATRTDRERRYRTVEQLTSAWAAAGSR